MASSDVEAGRAFVTLYVRDRAFRTQMAENEAIYNRSLSGEGTSPDERQLDHLGDSVQGYQRLGETADETMQTIFDGTAYIADETERLNDALEAVLNSYQDLAGMQEEGITLAIGGPGGGAEFGGDEGWLDTGQIEHTLESGAVGGMGKELGSAAMQGMMRSSVGKIAGEIGGKLRDKLFGQLKDGADQAIDALGAKAMDAGRNLLGGPGVGQIAAATKGADIVMAELVPAAKEAEIVMAEIVPTATAATTATAGLGTSLAALGPAAAIAAVAAVALVPVLAAIDDVTGGTLSNSGYYPEWLKKIGDAMNVFGVAGIVVKTLATVFGELWSVLRGVYELFSNLSFLLLPAKVAMGALTTAVSLAIKAAFLPLHAALFALNGPFRAVHLAVKGIQGVFTLAQTAVVGFVDLVKSIPGAAMSAVSSLGRMAASATATAAGFASSAWNGAMDTIRGIGSSLQTAGKTLAIVGGGMAALGGLIVAPLTKAAEKFAEHGKEVYELAEKYDITTEAAATYAYMAAETGQKVKDLTKSVQEGSDEFGQWNKLAYAAGWTIGDSAKSAVALCQAYREVKDALHGLWVQLGRAVAPAVEESTKLFAAAIRVVTTFVRNHQDLIATAFKVGSAIAGVGTALATVGGVLMSVGAAISPFAVALAGIAGGMAIVEYRTKVGSSLWDHYKDSVTTVVGTIISTIQPMVQEVQNVVGGIQDAILGGDIELAFTIVVEEVKAVWAGGLAWLAEKTGGIFGDILANLAAGRWKAAADGAMGALTAAFWRVNQVADDVWEGIKSTGATVWSYLQDGFDLSLVAIESGWIRLVDKIKEVSVDMLRFMANDIFGPMTRFLVKYDISGKLAGTALEAQRLLMNGLETIKQSRSKSINEDIEKLEADSLKRRRDRHEKEQQAQSDRDEAAVGRRVDRQAAIEEAESRGRSPDRALNRKDAEAAAELTKDWQADVDRLWDTAAKRAQNMDVMENNPAVYDAFKRADAAREWEEAYKRAQAEEKRLAEFKAGVAERTGPVAEAQANKSAAEKARDEAIARAEQLRKDMARPEDPDDPEKKATKSSGFVTTSAYAFGQFGSADPARNQLEEMKKARQEALDERKQRDKDWNQLLAYQRMLAAKSPQEARELMMDLM